MEYRLYPTDDARRIDGHPFRSATDVEALLAAATVAEALKWQKWELWRERRLLHSSSPSD
jgi:hypothetical protein